MMKYYYTIVDLILPFGIMYLKEGNTNDKKIYS